MADTIQILDALRSIPIPDLVERLRAVRATQRNPLGTLTAARRQRNSVGRKSPVVGLPLLPLPKLAGSPFAARIPDVPEAVRALKAIHAVTANGAMRRADAYASASRRLRDFEKDLHRHAALVDRVLARGGGAPVATGQDLASQPVASQQTLRLQCAIGELSGGRFRCRNGTGREARVVVRPGSFTHRDGEAVEGASVRVEPEETILAAGDSALFRAIVDLSAMPGSGGEIIEGVVDVLLNGDLGTKLWVEIETYAP